LAVHVTGMLAMNCWVCPCGVFADTGLMTMGETTVTFAVLLPLPFVAVAVTVQLVLAYSGAFKRPVEEIVPQFFVHVAAELAVNCWVAFSWTVAVPGEMEKPVDVGAVIVSNVYAVYFTVPVAIAWIVQFVPTVPLAVYSPLELMVPHLAVHVTGIFAVNCCVFPCGVFADVGEMVIAEITVTLALTLPLPLVAFAVTVHVAEG
jgi:hypothetical protein